jgi:hypothetical protein
VEQRPQHLVQQTVSFGRLFQALLNLRAAQLSRKSGQTQGPRAAVRTQSLSIADRRSRHYDVWRSAPCVLTGCEAPSSIRL